MVHNVIYVKATTCKSSCTKIEGGGGGLNVIFQFIYFLDICYSTLEKSPRKRGNIS